MVADSVIGLTPLLRGPTYEQLLRVVVEGHSSITMGVQHAEILEVRRCGGGSWLKAIEFETGAGSGD